MTLANNFITIAPLLKTTKQQIEEVMHNFINDTLYKGQKRFIKRADVFETRIAEYMVYGIPLYDEEFKSIIVLTIFLKNHHNEDEQYYALSLDDESLAQKWKDLEESGYFLEILLIPFDEVKDHYLSEQEILIKEQEKAEQESMQDCSLVLL